MADCSCGMGSTRGLPQVYLVFPRAYAMQFGGMEKGWRRPCQPAQPGKWSSCVGDALNKVPLPVLAASDLHTDAYKILVSRGRGPLAWVEMSLANVWPLKSAPHRGRLGCHQQGCPHGHLGVCGTRSSHQPRETEECRIFPETQHHPVHFFSLPCHFSCSSSSLVHQPLLMLILSCCLLLENLDNTLKLCLDPTHLLPDRSGCFALSHPQHSPTVLCKWCKTLNPPPSSPHPMPKVGIHQRQWGLQTEEG